LYSSPAQTDHYVLGRDLIHRSTLSCFVPYQKLQPLNF